MPYNCALFLGPLLLRSHLNWVCHRTDNFIIILCRRMKAGFYCIFNKKFSEMLDTMLNCVVVVVCNIFFSLCLNIMFARHASVHIWSQINWIINCINIYFDEILSKSFKICYILELKCLSLVLICN